MPASVSYCNSVGLCHDPVDKPRRRIGSVKDGKVTAFIPALDPKVAMPEGLAADKDGNVFGGFATGMDFKKFSKN